MQETKTRLIGSFQTIDEALNKLLEVYRDLKKQNLFSKEEYLRGVYAGFEDEKGEHVYYCWSSIISKTDIENTLEKMIGNTFIMDGSYVGEQFPTYIPAGIYIDGENNSRRPKIYTEIMALRDEKSKSIKASLSKLVGLGNIKDEFKVVVSQNIYDHSS